MVGSSPAPVWPVVLLGILFFGSQLYLDKFSGGFRSDVFAETLKAPPQLSELPPEEKLYLRGQLVYANCAACHQPSGSGTPGQFPPLTGSEWVLAPKPDRIMRIVLDGLGGPVKVKDQDWNNQMVPWRDVLSDADIAAVITFIRRNKEWGHSASAVTEAEVKAARNDTSSHAGTPWNAEDLLKVPVDK